MTLTNEQRSDRCGDALMTYSDDDLQTNLVDWLSDAMHWCHCNECDFNDVLESARMHFSAELFEESVP